MNKTEALKIVDAIIADLNDRQGLKHEWRGCDKSIQREIRNTWARIIMKTAPSSREKERP